MLVLLVAGPSRAEAPATPAARWSPAAGAARGMDDAALRRASMQPPPGGGMDYGQPDESEEHRVQLAPPGPERLFRLESEKSLQERMRQEARQRPTLERIAFPDEPVLSTESYAARVFPPAREVVEPNYVCYKRLLFEQKNLERYGWDLGFITPFVSAGKFYWDVVWMPYHIWTAPCRWYECSAGYCLPGDPVPLLIYPPELSLTGTVMEAGTIVALFAIFPG